jgi:hypothetical protein
MKIILKRKAKSVACGPRKFAGLWWSVKLDSTLFTHALFAALGCLLHPLIPIIYYLAKEVREGTGWDFNDDGIDDCVGFGKCLQGFGLDDFGVVILVAVPWWIWLPSILKITL